VLAAGGWDGTTTHITADLHQPTSNTWSVTGPMAQTRRDHTATLLTTGRVLVVGGQNSAPLASAELFDPTLGVWQPTAAAATSRYHHTATLLADGRVLVAGGRDATGALASAEIYNPLTEVWTPTGALTTPRALHTATLLATGMVLVVGGENGDVLATAELFDPATGNWTTAAGMATARYGHTATLLPTGGVLVAAGSNGSAYQNTAEFYYPPTGLWYAMTSLTTARANHRATLLPNGKLLVAGGLTASGITSLAELFDPAANTWLPTGLLATARESHTATLLANGSVFVHGGTGTAGASNTAESYEPGLGFTTASQPVITTAPTSILLGEAIALTGSRFRGISEGSGGNSGQHSAHNGPVVKLRALDGGQTVVLQPGTNGSATSFTSTAITGFPLGYTLVTVFANGIPSSSKIIKLTVPDPPPYDLWKATHFTAAELADPATSGDLADPDHDGTANLLEYVQALNPKLSDVTLLPTLGRQVGFPTLTYRLNKKATDVTVSVESSADLTSWLAVASTLSQVDQGTYWLVTAIDTEPIATTPRRFMRLRVTKP
jgi:hypothetical protein